MATLPVLLRTSAKNPQKIALLSHARDKFQLFIFELDTRSLHKPKVKVTYIFQLYYFSSVWMENGFLMQIKTNFFFSTKINP